MVLIRAVIGVFVLAALGLAGILPGPVPTDLTILHDSVLWAWASPCDGGCSMPLPTYQVGWRYATDPEWASRPLWSDFLRPDGSVRCASPYFDPNYTHCDLGDAQAGYVTSHPTGFVFESWFVSGGGAVIPEPSGWWLAGGGLLGLLIRKRRRD